MTPYTPCRRPAVLAYSLRSREYIRRVLRSFGYAPLVFVDLAELAGMNPGPSSIDVLVLGDVSDVDPSGRNIFFEVLEVIGPDVPVLDVSMQGRVRRTVHNDELVRSRVRSFSDLYRDLGDFLQSLGMKASKPLSWGPYLFNPPENSVTFAGRTVTLDAIAFDVAIDFFFSRGQTLTRNRLQRMLPSFHVGPSWHRIENIGCTVDDVRAALDLHAPNCWVIHPVGVDGYVLHRVPAAETVRPLTLVRRVSTARRPPRGAFKSDEAVALHGDAGGA